MLRTIAERRISATEQYIGESVDYLRDILRVPRPTPPNAPAG